MPSPPKEAGSHNGKPRNAEMESLGVQGFALNNEGGKRETAGGPSRSLDADIVAAEAQSFVVDPAPSRFSNSVPPVHPRAHTALLAHKRERIGRRARQDQAQDPVLFQNLFARRGSPSTPSRDGRKRRWRYPQWTPIWKRLASPCAAVGTSVYRPASAVWSALAPGRSSSSSAPMRDPGLDSLSWF